MDRRILRAGVTSLVALAASLSLMAGTASARGTAVKAAAEPTTGSCVINSNPSFTLQGEYETFATAGDVIQVECNPEIFGTGSEVEVTAAQLYSRCKDDITWYDADLSTGPITSGPGVRLTLDADGNAIVGLIAGPDCEAGDGTVSVHMLQPPFESFTTSFATLPPGPSEEGVTAIPNKQVETGQFSDVATIIQAEFPGKAETPVRLASPEYNARCQEELGGGTHGLFWILENREIVPAASEVQTSLDDDGNAFALTLGLASCYPGPSLIEADLLNKPYTTKETSFLIQEPQVTEF